MIKAAAELNCTGEKKLFFGWEVEAPWPDHYPSGRLLTEKNRHLTFAFLGKIDYSQFEPSLSSFPSFPFKLGFVGQFDQCLFLPERNPRVVAWHVHWFDQDSSSLFHYQRFLIQWLNLQGYFPDSREFLPHVTLCRAPFFPRQWKKAFSPLPCMVKDLHLFESTGHLHYQPLRTYSLTPPFEELEHTADIAFRIYGETLSQLFLHAQIALAFRFPPLLSYLSSLSPPLSLDHLITSLNAIVSRADAEIGCPFKAISFHGDLEKNHQETLFWEMIVDV